MSIESNELKIAQLVKEKIDDLQVDTEFLNYLKGLPSDISQNGLLQTMAFINGKKPKDAKYRKLCELFDHFFENYFGQNDLLSTLLELNSMETYRYYQQGFLIYASWLKRLALALKQSSEPDSH